MILSLASSTSEMETITIFIIWGYPTLPLIYTESPSTKCAFFRCTSIGNEINPPKGTC